MPLEQEDVLGFDVHVHDSVLVQLAQALQDLMDAEGGKRDVPGVIVVQLHTQRHLGRLEDHHGGPFIAEDLWNRCRGL